MTVNDQPSPACDVNRLIPIGGSMADRLRTSTRVMGSIGALADWPTMLRGYVNLMLESPAPTWLAWGPDLILLYNDAMIPVLGSKHPHAFGIPLADVWSETWGDVEPLVEKALGGTAFIMADLPLKVLRSEELTDAWFTFSYTPLRAEDAEIHGIYCAVQDTTEGVLSARRRDIAEAALREQNASLETAVSERTRQLRLYETIVRCDASPICAFDTDYRLIAFNQAHNDEFNRVNGFETKIGDVFPDLFIPEQRPVMRALMDRALAGETFTEVEAFGNPELGTPHWEINYTPMRDDDGTIVGAFHHARNISDRLVAEAELETARQALRQSQKMEAVGQLTGGLAHDFNNLLTGVMGNLELLQMRVTKGRLDNVERFITAAQGAGRRAAALTQRLLAFSRRQTLDPKPTDVNRLIRGMEDLIYRTIGPGITLEVVGAAGLWTASIDAGQLENALLNLCINARDAMPDGGRLTIETANKWIDDRAGRERDLPVGQYLSLCVTDTGTGMTPETIARAFDPFFTTKPMGEGTGLGLSMIYGFARQSGGQVRIYSEVGHGTTMCIYLPRYIGEANEPTADADKAQAETVQGVTVLVVDDEPTVRNLIDEVLSELGYAVIDAIDGPSGLKVLQSDVRIDLLITDVGLPNGMNGRQVADAARDLRPRLPVLFITGYAENAAVGNGHMTPGMELLTKPFSMVDLIRRVNSMLDAGSPRQMSRPNG